MCLRASMQCFDYQFKGQFQFPKEYNEQLIKDFLLAVKKFFERERNQENMDMLDLIEDIWHIIFEGNSGKLHIESKLYGHTDKKANGNLFMQNNAMIAEDVRA